MSRIVSVTGDASGGHNMLVPIGTPVSEILANAQDIKNGSDRIVWGNCLTGIEIMISDSARRVPADWGQESQASSWVEAWNSACLLRCPRGERPLVELYLEPGGLFRTMHGRVTAPSC